jgi:ribokinase
MTPGRVIVVGSVNVDLVVRASTLPRPGETVIGGTFSRHHGGKGANQAVAAARLGAETLFVGAVGDDDLGAAAGRALAAEDVDVKALAVVPGVSTGVALIVVAADGENAISVAPGANAAVTRASVRDALASIAPGDRDVVVVSNEIPPDAVLVALEIGRGAGSRIVLNPAPADGIDERALALTHVLTPNANELAALAGPGTPESAARSLFQSGVATAVVVTLGGAGALLVSSGADPARLVPAPGVEVIDTTGAGDTFNGCLAASLAMGMGLEVAVRRAVVAASLSTTRAGAREGMPTLPELEAALAR